MIPQRPIAPLAAYLALLCLAPSALRAAPVDLSPPRNALGAADENGHVRYVHRFGDLLFSDNFSIPLRFDFSSKRVVEDERSDFGWHGWRCGAVESEATFLEEGRLLRIDLLCAKVMVLERVEGEDGRYLTADGAWSGLVEGDEVRVEREDGWSLAFLGGKVDRFRTDKGRMIRWIRDDAGKVVRVLEEGAESPALVVQWDGERASALVAGELHYELDYRDDALAAFRWKSLEGVERSIQCRQAKGSLHLETTRSTRYRFQWDERTGIVVADGGTRYSTRSTEGTRQTILTMTEPSGAVSSYELGRSNGQIRRSHPQGGEIVVTRVVSGGRDNGAVAKVEWLREGKPAETLLLNHFDEKGRIVRRLWLGDPIVHRGYAGAEIEAALLPDREGVHPAGDLADGTALSMIEYAFTDDDKLLGTKVDGEPVLDLTYDAQGRPLALSFRNRYEKTFAYGEDGSVVETLSLAEMEEGPFWYLESDDPTVGPDLVVSFAKDADGRLLERTYADGRRLVVTYDARLRRVRDETRARDGKSLVSTVTYVHPPAGGPVLRIAEDHLAGAIEHAEIQPGTVGLDLPGRRIPREAAAAAATAN